jgi:hypothetical protein
MMDSASFEVCSGVAKESILLGYNTVSMGKQFPLFSRTVVSFIWMEEL